MSDEPAKIILGDTAISAIERTPGRRWFARSKDRHRVLTQCENCGAQLTGNYCAQCGQAAVDYRRSFRHVVADVLESFLNWDSKFFTTIALLILKPWRLTNEFLAGKRVRYETQSKRPRGTRSGFEERRPATCSARAIGGIITRISFAQLLTSKHVAIAYNERPLAFTRTRNRQAKAGIRENRRATVRGF